MRLTFQCKLPRRYGNRAGTGSPSPLATDTKRAMPRLPAEDGLVDLIHLELQQNPQGAIQRIPRGEGGDCWKPSSSYNRVRLSAFRFLCPRAGRFTGPAPVPGQRVGGAGI